ncbi:MAG TPA: hypothetical protein VLG12_03535 [Candidatus Saccharimonadales bacterium]|nr:hypothetical protein [Candidatus Saccharimonadales bacterium]
MNLRRVLLAIFLLGVASFLIKKLAFGLLGQLRCPRGGACPVGKDQGHACGLLCGVIFHTHDDESDPCKCKSGHRWYKDKVIS